MKIYTPNSPSVFNLVFIYLMLLLTSTVSVSQSSACCDCEKMIWTIKVTLMDKWAPVQEIDYKTYVGQIKLEKKNQDDMEFPGNKNLKQFTYEEKPLVIRLNDDEVERASGLGGTHKTNETNMSLYISATIGTNSIGYSDHKDCNTSVDNLGLMDTKTDLQLINLNYQSVHSKGIESRFTHRLLKEKQYKHKGGYVIVNKTLGSASWILKPMINIESESNKCHSAHCYMPLKVIFLWGDEETEESKDETAAVLSPQEDLIFTPYSTGNTNGKIIDLEAKNPTGQSIMFSIPPSIVPPTGKSQGYTILDETTGEVSPGETLTFPIDGWCYDLHSKPVPSGKVVRGIEDWVSVISSPPPFEPGTTPPEGTHFTYAKHHPGMEHQSGVPVGGTYCTYPGTDSLFDYTIDIREHYDDAAPFLIESMYRITTVYDSLKEAGVIETPFSFNPVKEKESVLQQTYWIYTSLLKDKPYTKDQFVVKLIEQYEENTDTKYKNAPETVKEQLEEGADQFWTTFNIVGEQAKVLNVIDAQDVEEDVSSSKDCCDADYAEVEVKEEKDPYEGITFEKGQPEEVGKVTAKWIDGELTYVYKGGKPRGYKNCLLPKGLGEDKPSIDIGVYDFEVSPTKLCCKRGKECIIYDNLDLHNATWSTYIYKKIRQMNQGESDQEYSGLSPQDTAALLKAGILFDRAGYTTTDPQEARKMIMHNPDFIIDGKVIFSCCEEEGKEGQIRYSLNIYLIDPESSETLSTYTIEPSACYNEDMFTQIDMIDEISRHSEKAFEQFKPIISN